jgi:hypothetical protein
MAIDEVAASLLIAETIILEPSEGFWDRREERKSGWRPMGVAPRS